jgi:hypothetical protein
VYAHSIVLLDKLEIADPELVKASRTKQVESIVSQKIGSSKVKVNVRLPPAASAVSGDGELLIFAANEDSAKATCELRNRPVTNSND